jgi:predicted transcriptional regulator
MSALSVRLPESLHQALRDLAEKEGVSMNQLITQALAEKIASLETESYLQTRAARGSRDAFEEALNQVADVEPDNPDDKL